MEDEVLEINYKNPYGIVLPKKKKKATRYEERWVAPNDDEIPWIPIRPQLRTSTTATSTNDYDFVMPDIRWEQYRFVEEKKPEPPKPPQRASFWRRIFHPFG